MSKTLAANIRRLILATKSRFFALTAIVTIGVAFFVGVSATSPIMGQSVDYYDDEMNMKDITVYSNYGFDQADIDAIAALEEVELCEGGWFADVLATADTTTVVTRIHSWQEDQMINHFRLREGRLPRNAHEAVAEAGTTLKSGFTIGSKVTFSYPEGSENESLLIDEVTIVGVIDTPLYLNMTKENSTLSNQYIQTYLYVPAQAFDNEFFLEANILLKDGQQKYTFSEEYEDYADAAKKEIEALARTQKDVRIGRIRQDALKEYEDGLRDYEDGVREYNEKIADAEQQIADGEKEVIDGMAEISDGWKQYNEGVDTLNRETADALAKLNDAARLAAEGRAEYEKGKAEFAAAKAELLNNLKQVNDGIRQIDEGIDSLEKAADGLRQIDDGLQQTEEALENMKKAAEAIDELKNDTVLHADDPVSVLLGYAPEMKQLTDLLGIGEDDTIADLQNALSLMQSGLQAAQAALDLVPDELRDLSVAQLENLIADDGLSILSDIAAVLGGSDDSSVQEMIAAAEDLVPAEYREMTIAEIREQLPPETADIIGRIAELIGLDENASINDVMNAVNELVPEEIRTATIGEVRALLSDELIMRLDELAAEVGADASVNDLAVYLQEQKQQLDEAADAIAMLMEMPVLSDDTKLSVLMSDEDMAKLIAGLELDGEDTVKDLEDKLKETIAQLEKLQKELQDQKQMILDELAKQGIDPKDIGRTIEDLRKQKEELQKTAKLITDGIAEGEAQLKAAEEKLLAGEAEIADGRRQLDEETASAWAKLYDARKELLDGQKKIDDALADLAEARKELEEGRESGLQELQDAKKKLDDAKKEIDDLKPGEWTVLDRTQHYATATYKNTVDQMKAIGNIFPVFFILVAALVCLTTMTRLVDEQRGEIGTLRALGYTEVQCAGKYLIYAGSATLLGEVLGIIAGMLIFPAVIYNTWRMMYILPPIRLQIPWGLVMLCCISFLAGMLLTTWLACRQDMREVPAQLMRPKAPKMGRTTLIERIPVIWNRLSFTWKVTMRNLFRYKRRFFMTVAGVAGCGALLVTGFGIRDSINSMVDIQFYDIYRYHGTAELKHDLSDEECRDLMQELLRRPDVESLTQASVYSAKAAGNTKMDETVTVEIFSDPEDIKEVYDLRTRRGRKPVILSNDGVIINEKLAENLDLKIGDTIALEGADGGFADVPVAGITEMYIQHYVFMSEDVYLQYFHKPCENRALMIRVSGDEETQKKVEEALANMPQVESVSFFTVLLNNFRDMVKGLNFVVWTLIISSMSLAFVVLGNLINVNISERQREIATLKVLGFRRREVESYIYKENNVLTLIGAVVALPIGTLLHHYIMRTVEMDYIMFGRDVLPMSYVYAVGLTLLFGVMVDHFMASRLHEIQMVESLKSVE